MSKIEKAWETRLSDRIPYMAWGGLAPESRSCWTTSRHSNTCYELHIILDGACNLAFDEQIHPMTTGQAVLIAPNVFHAPSGVSDVFCRFSISFSIDQLLSPTLAGVDREGYRFFIPGTGTVNLCREIIREMDAASFSLKSAV